MGKGEGLAVMAGDMSTHKDQMNRLWKKAKSAEKKEYKVPETTMYSMNQVCYS